MEQLSQSRTVDSDGNYLLKSPPGFPTIPSSSNEDLSLNLLQNYSINSLLEHEDFLWNNDGETTSVSDLLGLNSPRGLLNLNFSNSVCTPSSSSQNPQGNYEEGSFGGCKPKTRVKTFQRNISLGSAGSSPTSPPFLGRSFRSMSFSDSCGSNSPALYEQHPILGRNFSRSDSVDVNAARNSNNTDLNDILNQLSLSDTLTRNLMATAPISDLDLSQLQNLQAIHAMKYLQQAPTFRQTNVTNNAQLLEKWQVNQQQQQQQQHLNTLPENSPLDRAAKFHRSAASVYDAVCTWSGVLPPCTDKCSAGYSSKVFLGGIPWDMSEECLVQAFRQFGPVSIEWPGKEKQANQPKGYAYLVLESEKSVRDLLSQCVNRYENSGSFYFKICSKRIKMKEVQVIPWFLSDSNYTKSASQKLDPSKTVFVGALHGTLTAQGLAKVMNDLFDGVVYAGIDTDKYKYPIGSGRVTFNNSRSYMKAVSAAFIEIKTSKFSKKVQVDPYLEESLCSLCGVQQGPYFCRDITCFRYYCRTCWSCQHGTDLRHHNPMSRNSKHNLQQGGLFGNASNKTGLRL